MLPRFHPRHRLKAWPLRRPFDPYLVAYWPFWLGSGTILHDEGPNLIHGTLNAPTWTNGKLVYALNFDGLDDEVNCGSGAALDFLAGEGRTTLAWIKTTRKTAYQQVVSHYDGVGTTVFDLFTVINTGQVGVEIRDSIGTTYVYLFSLRDVCDGAWHRIGYVRRAVPQGIEVYVDGLFEAAKTDKNVGNYTFVSDLKIGRKSNGTQPFLGQICEVMIIRRDFSPAEMLRDYLRQA